MTGAVAVALVGRELDTAIRALRKGLKIIEDRRAEIYPHIQGGIGDVEEQMRRALYDLETI